MNTPREAVEELIGVINSLCDVITDMPCSCDICPYQDENDIEGDGCMAGEIIERARKMVE